MIEDCPGIHQWQRDVPRSPRRPVIIGAVLLLVWGVGFGAWAALAPLDGAIVASGRFVATGQNKQVQHLEGGIVRETLVKEGDLVEVGQPVIRLDNTAANAKLRRLVLRQYRLMAIQARLKAEIAGRSMFEVPDALVSRSEDPEIKSVVEGQLTELTARRAKLDAEEMVLRKESAALQESIKGYESQVASIESRLALFDAELKDKSDLLDRQLVRKPEIFALQRSQASLSGDQGEILGRMADARERIARAEQQIAQIRSASVQEAVESLRKTETDLDDVMEQARAARDILERTEVRAPVRGIVVKLNYNTPGGVIGAGDAILELLPVDDSLVIEARVRPNDIVHVKEGQAALVRLSALNQRLTPMIAGKVQYVSADAVPEHDVARPGDSASDRRSSFVVRVKLNETDARYKAHDFRPTPGLPADIYITTAERTFLDYMMRPVRDTFSRAFRES